MFLHLHHGEYVGKLLGLITNQLRVTCMSPIRLDWDTTALLRMFMYLYPSWMFVRMETLENMVTVIWMSRRIQLIGIPSDLMWKENP